MITDGRFAPSPTGRLHLGNLRTALLAWLFARHGGGRFLLRFEDLDQASVRPEHYRSQAADLHALGLDWDGRPNRQSDRIDRYRAVIEELTDRGLVYRCYCSRKDIREATMAPNGIDWSGRYPGTCRNLGTRDRTAREADGRPPALRFRVDPEGAEHSFHDLLAGRHSVSVDDFVVQRNDGTPAYNLASTIDDTDDGIGLIVRADDLLDSTPRQLLLLGSLDHAAPTHAHVPLVLNAAGDRLAKRDGAVTLADRIELGQSAIEVRSLLAASVGLCHPAERPTLEELLRRFDPARLPRSPWQIPVDGLERNDLGL
jgi:glutamyl-tRNA synthetase